MIEARQQQKDPGSDLPSHGETAEPGGSDTRAEALKSSSIIGGSSFLVLLIRMVRTKVLAVFLGPAGVGLESVFESTINLSKTLFGVGIYSSGVRQIAAAAGSDDKVAISRTILVLRWVCILLGVVGAVTVFLSRESISRFAFGHAEYASGVGVLSVMMLFGAVAGGQATLLQGLRRISDLAKVKIFGALAGAAVSIPIVIIWGREGIPYYMAATAAAGMVISWLYARRVQIERVRPSRSEALQEVSGLLRLGLAFLATGLLATGTLFLLRVLVTREMGAEGAGQFQAASALSMVYVGFILQAMGTDFYPRLTAVAKDNARCNRLVNEQAEISLLLALPGIVATIAFAPWVVLLFYSDKFDAAGEILCWQMGGNLLRVLAWPAGYILVAKGFSRLFVLTDFLSFSAYLVFAWFGLKWIGLPGIGMAFLGQYVFHALMITFIASRCTGFRWSRVNFRVFLLGLAAVVVALYARLALPEPWSTLLGVLLAAALGVICLRALAKILGPARINRVFQKLRVPFRFPEPPSEES